MADRMAILGLKLIIVAIIMWIFVGVVAFATEPQNLFTAPAPPTDSNPFALAGYVFAWFSALAGVVIKVITFSFLPPPFGILFTIVSMGAFVGGIMLLLLAFIDVVLP